MSKLSLNSKSNGSSYIFEPYKFNEGDTLIVRVLGKKMIESKDYSFEVVHAIELLSNRRISLSNQVFLKNFHLINERIVKITCLGGEVKVINGNEVFVPQIQLEGVSLSMNDDGNLLIVND